MTIGALGPPCLAPLFPDRRAAPGLISSSGHGAAWACWETRDRFEAKTAASKGLGWRVAGFDKWGQEQKPFQKTRV